MDTIAAIRAARFTPVRLRTAYDMSQVDTFLDELVDAVGAGRDLAPMITAALFTTTSLREGYAIDEVDAFLESLSASGPTSSATTKSSYAAPDHAVVQEVPGLLARLFHRR